MANVVLLQGLLKYTHDIQEASLASGLELVQFLVGRAKTGLPPLHMFCPQPLHVYVEGGERWFFLCSLQLSEEWGGTRIICLLPLWEKRWCHKGVTFAL